jgi:hypothetical protein
MSARPPVDSEHAWQYCPACGQLNWPGITHDCYDGAGDLDGPLRVAVTLALIAAIVGILAWLLATRT